MLAGGMPSKLTCPRAHLAGAGLAGRAVAQDGHEGEPEPQPCPAAPPARTESPARRCVSSWRDARWPLQERITTSLRTEKISKNSNVCVQHGGTL